MEKQKAYQILSLIDLTSLNENDNHESILALCQKAITAPNNIAPAAICVYDRFAALVKENSSVPLAIVAGDFPNGTLETSKKITHLQSILHAQIDEVDVVINPIDVKENNQKAILNELCQMRKICSDKILKVIIESGHLSQAQIEFASQCVLVAEADFVKTSTGKKEIGATLESVEIICHLLKSYYIQTGKRVGIKISGGVKSFEQAKTYVQLVERILGSEWIQPKYFRIGASSLWDNIINDLSE